MAIPEEEFPQFLRTQGQKALLAGAQLIMQQSKKLAPIARGTLRKTGRVKPKVTKAGSPTFEVVILFGDSDVKYPAVQAFKPLYHVIRGGKPRSLVAEFFDGNLRKRKNRRRGISAITRFQRRYNRAYYIATRVRGRRGLTKKKLDWVNESLTAEGGRLRQRAESVMINFYR